MERLEFELLSSIAEGQDLSLRKETFGFSDKTLEAAKSQIIEKGWLDAEGITEAGLAALEPYKVKRVIFLAAGFGSRMVPITINTPKPMVVFCQ